MNIFFKAFCRIYQMCFRAVLPLLPYREPEILKTYSELAELLKASEKNSVLIVTDKTLNESGITQKLKDALSENGISCAVYDGTRPNPTVENVGEAKDMYIRENCKAIIAFGGGSSMDCAKAVGAMIAYPEKPLYKMRGLLKVLRRIPTLVAIPTTAGTGSEVTVTAVITDDLKKHKYTMNNFTTIPHYAILDPTVTLTLPKSLTATTGMDALTHAVEAYIGRSTTAKTRKLSLEAVKLIFENIETAYNDGSNLTARENMLKASYMAGAAFTKSYVGYIHAVAHSLGGRYNIPHGLANSVLMPTVLEAYGKAAQKKLCELAISAGVASENDSYADGSAKFISAIKELNAKMGIPTVFPQIKKEDIPEMAKHAANEANPLYPVPVLWNAKELYRFYYSTADWRDEK